MPIKNLMLHPNFLNRSLKGFTQISICITALITMIVCSDNIDIHKTLCHVYNKIMQHTC